MEINERIIKYCGDRGITVSTAESCTGGLIAKLLTDVPGSSSVLLGGIVSYCNKAKIELLSVSPETIDRYTEVSDKAAEQMAEGTKKSFDSHIGVSTTGYAGPGGDKVGLVFVGISSKLGTRSYKLEYGDTLSRSEIRERASAFALEKVLLCAEELNFSE